MRKASERKRSYPGKSSNNHWIAGLAALLLVGAVLYAAFWAGVVLAGVLVVAFVARTSPAAESTEWDIDKPSDPRDGLFYHPQDHNDDPDPRWDYPKR